MALLHSTNLQYGMAVLCHQTTSRCYFRILHSEQYSMVVLCGGTSCSILKYYFMTVLQGNTLSVYCSIIWEYIYSDPILLKDNFQKKVNHDSDTKWRWVRLCQLETLDHWGNQVFWGFLDFFFFMWTIFKVFTEFVNNITPALWFVFWAVTHVGSLFPD